VLLVRVTLIYQSHKLEQVEILPFGTNFTIQYRLLQQKDITPWRKFKDSARRAQAHHEIQTDEALGAKSRQQHICRDQSLES